MERRLLVFLPGLLLLCAFNSIAQNWVNGGNALTANGALGTTNDFSLLFKTNNTERGRVTNNGLWGFGTNNPISKVQINSVADQIPFRVDVNGIFKFIVHSGGGVSIGNTSNPPVNGLSVQGNVGIGTSAPENKLHVFKGNAGNVTGFVNASLIVENSTNNYINILAPDANETGILFGKPAGNADGAITYNSAGAPKGLQFSTNGNISRMILSDIGNLGIGTSPGRYKLTVRHSGGGAGGINIENTNFQDIDHWEIFNGGDLLLFCRDGLVGNFNGFTGGYSSLSDKRLKTNIEPMGIMLEKIGKLKPSTFQFKNSADNKEYNGFIAQDVMKVFPEMVTHNLIPERNLDVYTMDYSQFGVLAVKGIQELQSIFEEQQRINEAQKLEVIVLKERLAKIEAALATITSNKKINVLNVITNASPGQNKLNSFNKNTKINSHFQTGSSGK